MASKNLTAGKKRGFGLYLDAAGIVLAVAGAVAAEHAFATIGFTGVKVIGARVILASGLFSWNASNQIGWGVFNSTIVATVLLVVAALVLVVAAFLPAFKDAEPTD